jgi:outer membrane protein TolC
MQRPSSPPKVPPPLLPRTNGQGFYTAVGGDYHRATRPLSPPSLPPPPPPQAPPQIPFHNRLTTNNLLNTILNNSLNSDVNRSQQQQHRAAGNYEQFNDSFNSSVTHNNSVFNNTTNGQPAQPNGNQNYLSYYQLLNTPNLYTLFDRKKQPPPPYPGGSTSPHKVCFIFLKKK